MLAVSFKRLFIVPITDTSVASVMDSIKTHDRENIQQMFSTRFFNRALITRLGHSHHLRVEMATIVTYIQG